MMTIDCRNDDFQHTKFNAALKQLTKTEYESVDLCLQFSSLSKDQIDSLLETLLTYRCQALKIEVDEINNSEQLRIIDQLRYASQFQKITLNFGGSTFTIGSSQSDQDPNYLNQMWGVVTSQYNNAVSNLPSMQSLAEHLPFVPGFDSESLSWPALQRFNCFAPQLEEDDDPRRQKKIQ